MRRALSPVLGGTALLLAAALPAAAAPAAPVLARDGAVLVATRLPALLSRPEVAEHLTSGLTTTFSLTAAVRDQRGGKLEGGALVEIRFEPWDEVYFVAWAGAAGGEVRSRLDSSAALERWWRELRLPLAEGSGLAAEGDWQVRLELAVIPFSSAEQRDTQTWVSRSLGTAREAGRSPGSNAPPAATETPALSEVLDVLLATSIGRESVIRYDWRLSVPPAEAEPEASPETGTGGGR
jgi:hypothetical protein